MISAWDLLSDAGKDAVRQADGTALPSVEPLPPGARPTEPGWYVAKRTNLDDGVAFIVQVINYEDPDDPEWACGWVIYYAGNDCSWPLDREIEKEGLAFIARIYPARIGQE